MPLTGFTPADFVFAEKWKLAYSPTEPPGTWEAEYVDGTFTLMLGSDFLSRLRAGIVDVGVGKGDYSIGLRRGTDEKPEDMVLVVC